MPNLFGRCPSCRALWATAVIWRGGHATAAATRAVVHRDRFYTKENGWQSRPSRVECPSCRQTFPINPPPQPAAA